MKKLFLVLIFTPAIAFAQTKQSLIGFQDIPWGAPVEAVRNKFPQIKSYDGCRPEDKERVAEAKNFFKKNDMSCISYNFDKYSIDGVNFCA